LWKQLKRTKQQLGIGESWNFGLNHNSQVSRPSNILYTISLKECYR
jgi:hypothetical protein